jgi:hypothetical protein
MPPVASAPAPVLETARWIPGGGATLIGPRLPQGTLVLLGGRRAVLRDDGVLETEKALAPEPLAGVVLVPTERGDRLVGYGRRGVVRFDDPLAAGVVLAAGNGDQDEVARAAPGPGLVALWRSHWASGATLIDVSTGALHTFPSLPPVAIEGLAFRSVREGTVDLAGLGRIETSDGGATFRLAAPPGSAPDAMPSAPLLRWIAATGLDPLRLAVTQEVVGGPVTVDANATLLRGEHKKGVAVTYHWRHSLDRGQTWILDESTPHATTEISGLPADTEVWIEVRATHGKDKGEWSHPVILKVR